MKKTTIKFILAKLAIFLAKKSKTLLIFDGVFSQVDGIFFFILSKYDTPHDFWELSKSIFETFLAQFGQILEGGYPMPPSPPPKKVVENYAHRNRVKNDLLFSENWWRIAMSMNPDPYLSNWWLGTFQKVVILDYCRLFESRSLG